jgi:hypothetical protein
MDPCRKASKEEREESIPLSHIYRDTIISSEKGTNKRAEIFPEVLCLTVASSLALVPLVLSFSVCYIKQQKMRTRQDLPTVAVRPQDGRTRGSPACSNTPRTDKETFMTQKPRNNMRAWHLLLGGCLWSVVLLTHCTAVRSPELVHKQLTLPVSPEVAYHQATVAMTRMGARMLFADGRSLQGVALNAVVLTVSVQPAPPGALIDVTGNLLPDRMALASFDEVDQYLALVMSSPSKAR